jgi:hypothetical protein
MIIEFLSKTDHEAEYGRKYLVAYSTLQLYTSNLNKPFDSCPLGTFQLSGFDCDYDTLVHVSDCKIIDGRIPSSWSCAQEYIGTRLEFTLSPSKWLDDSLWEDSFFNELDDRTSASERSYKEEVLFHWLECGQGLIECPFDAEDPFVKDVIAKYYQEQKRKSELTSRRNAYDIAEAMIKDRLSIEIIAKYTGFSEEDIGKMQKHPGVFNDGCKKTSL